MLATSNLYQDRACSQYAFGGVWLNSRGVGLVKILWFDVCDYNFPAIWGVS